MTVKNLLGSGFLLSTLTRNISHYTPVCVICGKNALRCSSSFTHTAPALTPLAGDGRFIALPQLKAILPWTHIIHFNSGTFTKEKMLSEVCSRGLAFFQEDSVGFFTSLFLFALSVNEHRVPLIYYYKVLPGLRMNRRYSRIL